MRIRLAKVKDAANICAVHVASINQICSSHYQPEQIERWTCAKTPAHYMESIENGEAVVAEENGMMTGFGQVAIKDGEIRAVYVHPDHIRRGAGSLLLAALEEQLQEAGFNSSRLASTLNALEFYEKHGYVSGEKAVHQTSAGLALECVRMEKSLL